MQSHISITIPTYNRASLLIEALASLQRQSMPDFECFVVDNGPSTDSTERDVRTFADRDPRFQYIRTGPLGCVVARNIGFQLSHSSLLMTLDDDVDLPDSGTLDFVIQCFRSDTRLGILGLSEYYPDGKGKGLAVERSAPEGRHAEWHDTTLHAPGRINRWGFIGTKLYHLPFGQLHEVDHVRSNSMAIRHEVFDRIGGFNPAYSAGGIGYRYETDFCVKAGKLGYKVVFSAMAPQSCHKAGERTKGWQRENRNNDYYFYTNRNNTFFFLSNYWSAAGGLVFLAWDILVGNSTQPGLWRLLHHRRASFKQAILSIAGKLSGWRMYWKQGAMQRTS